MATSGRYRALQQVGLLHPAPEAVVGEPFRSHPEFFASFDKVQVKYEMLRAHVVDGESATTAARAHGYSRASFYESTDASVGCVTGVVGVGRGRRVRASRGR